MALSLYIPNLQRVRLAQHVRLLGHAAYLPYHHCKCIDITLVGCYSTTQPERFGIKDLWCCPPQRWVVATHFAGCVHGVAVIHQG